MTPEDYYQQQCDQGVIADDPLQRFVLRQMQRVFWHLVKEHQARGGLLGALRRHRLIMGLYVWGSVGTGKTFLMDCLYLCLPFPQKKRMHFHQFMQYVHESLNKYQGLPDPLDIMAAELAKETMLLCFDEFLVTEIVDAMLLSRLLKRMFHHGICLVATSNVEPDRLYWRGLQREQFLPAISQLKQHTQVLHLAAKKDYRLQFIQSAGVFFTPHNVDANAQMERLFSMLSEGAVVTYDPLDICQRPIPIVKQAKNNDVAIVWFEFKVLCGARRSQQDYLAIAKRYATVLISDIKVIPAHAHDTILLLVRLVDVLYDSGVRLIFSAEQPIEQWYVAGSKQFEFSRTVSRLIEMQSDVYLAKVAGREKKSDE